MNEKDMQELLTDGILLLDQQAEEEGEEPKNYDISTFEDAMVCTTDKGLVIRMNDGSEFYITIKQTREANK